VKLITAVVRPATFEAVRNALRIFGVRGMTIAEVHESAPHSRHVQVYRGQRIETDLDAMIKIDLLVPDDEVTDLIHVIIKARGDDDQGPVWVTQVQLAVRVRTGEYGMDAL